MEPVNLGHSVKDIPVLNKKLYMKMMINSAERFIQNLRWKVIFFLNPNDKPKKENYEFKSTKTPPSDPDLKPFEDEIFGMIKNINPFQEKLKAELGEIRN